VYDFESDRINRKVGFLQRGFLSPAQLSAGFVLASLVPLLAAPLISQFLLFVFAQLLLLSYVYSAPPLRLKDRPVGGLFANAWSFGLLVSVAVMPDMTLHNSGLLGWYNPFYFFFAVGATYVLATIPDRPGDAATGKRTIAVVLGRSGALGVALALLVLAALTAYVSQYVLLFYLAVGSGFMVVAALFLGGDASVRFAAKAPLLVLTLAAGYLYPFYLLFVVALLLATRAYYRRRFGVIYPELA
jgi:4-hydroxybenzoate polyprenyltransferase